MDKFFKNQLYRWAYNKLKKDPKRFGTDGCNALFMQTYLFEIYNIFVPISALKATSSISRIKSDILLENPQWDKRDKDKSKMKIKESLHKKDNNYVENSEENRSN